MERVLFIFGIMLISAMNLLGQNINESKYLFKGLLGTEFEMLGELNSKSYCDVISVNGALTRGIDYSGSTGEPIRHWFSNDFAFKKVRLIEFEVVKIDTSKNQGLWLKVVTAWTNLHNRKKWNFDKKIWNFNNKQIVLKLPTTSYSYVGVHKLNGDIVRRISENTLKRIQTTLNIEKASIRPNEIIVVYFDSDEKVYIDFYRGDNKASLP
ncbi:MAG: hypothetical protein ACKO1F_05490 [Flammeovirgaceae bacterium]